MSDSSLEELSIFDVIFLGAVGSPKVKPGILEQGILLKLRFEFDQYINLRPVKLYPGITTPLVGKTSDDLDYIVVRENTGGLYTGVGGFTMKAQNMKQQAKLCFTPMNKFLDVWAMLFN